MKNEIIIYQPDEKIKLDVRLDQDTVWLSQTQMCELFQRERSVITKHINNVFREQECSENNNVQILHNIIPGRPLTLYSLDVIISVGYRVKSLRGAQFRRWATKILKEHLLRGYSINNRLEQVEHKLSKHDTHIEKLQQSVDFFVKTSLPPRQGVFYDGQVFDADVFVTKYILSAKESIILIDNYVNITTLEMLAKKGNGVQLKIVTSKKGNDLAQSDVKRFQEQYGKLEILESAAFHDRFLIIDDKDLYLSGASLKDLGKKCFAFTRLDSIEIPGLKARIQSV
ncbi:virulence RhuM family protein [bacterium]|nr:virulence RhuM family protein [bacterium]